MEPTNKDVVAALFRKMSEAVKRLEPDDWMAVLDGNFTVTILVNSSFPHGQQGGKGNWNTSDFADILQALREAQTRQAALALLQERCPSKEGLLQLTRFLDLPGQKRESLEKLQNRIIERTVGFRLRSRAVQGNPLPEAVTFPLTGPGTSGNGKREGTANGVENIPEDPPQDFHTEQVATIYQPRK